VKPTSYLLVFCALVTFAGDAFAGDGLEATWTLPAYADPERPTKGIVQLAKETAGALTCHYAIKDGPVKSAPCIPVEGKSGVYSFTAPPLGPKAEGEMKLWLTGKDGESSHQSLPVAAARFFDVTGEAAKPLYYPLPTPKAQGVFVPCCNIYAGELRILTLPINPAPNAEGLPKKVVGPFFILEPDDLTASTSGLNLEVKFGKAPTPDAKPAIFRFSKHSKKWLAVTTVEIDVVARRIRAACPSGGQLVFAWITDE
jgi:hypothetical protein